MVPLLFNFLPVSVRQV